MALPPLADPDALAAWVGQEIPVGDARAEAVLSGASAVVRAYANQTWVDANGALAADIPDVVGTVVVQVAARAWANPDGLQSVTIDDSTRRWGSDAQGLYLTDAEKALLDGLSTSSGSPGLSTLGMTRGTLAESTVYVPTAPAPSGYPFPWYSADDPLLG